MISVGTGVISFVDLLSDNLQLSEMSMRGCSEEGLQQRYVTLFKGMTVLCTCGLGNTKHTQIHSIILYKF